MATLVQDIYNIMNIASHGSVSTTGQLSEAQVRHWVLYHRELAINEYFRDMYGRVDQLLYQDLGCIELVRVDYAECPCQEIVWGCEVAKVTVPATVDLHGKPLFSPVLVDGRTLIEVVTPEIVNMVAHSRWTGRMVRAYMSHSTEDGMMDVYVIAPEELLHIRARGVFRDPTAVVTKVGSPGNCVDRCYDLDRDTFPMSGVLRGMVYRRILEGELQMTLSTVADIINNNRMDKAVTELKAVLTNLDLYGKKASPGTERTGSGRNRNNAG
jgi:hypothetical protein